MIYIRTIAYNAEKTVERTIKSILNQTYKNFKYYIIDNGSTDSTGDIIRKYAKEDSRICPFYSKNNYDYNENIDFWNISHNIPKDSYFCQLDADDFYAPSFFEEMLAFVKSNNLDIAACGTLMFDLNTDEVIANTPVQSDLICHTYKDFSENLSQMFWHIRQSWGKLYSSEAAAARFETDEPEWFPAYGGDTVIVMECLKKVKNFGIYAKPLHYYAVSQNSVSYKWDSRRGEADIILYQKLLEFIKDVCGDISDENNLFAYRVYANAIVDTANCIRNSNVSIKKRIEEYKKIVLNSVTKYIFENSKSEYFCKHYYNFIKVIVSEKSNLDQDSQLEFLTLLKLIEEESR